MTSLLASMRNLSVFADRLRSARASGLLALLMAVAITSPVQAQVDVPPVRQIIDRNGVDLYRGVITLQQTDLTMGAGASLLAYTRSWVNNGWRDSLIGGIDKNGSTLIVSLGDQSEAFTQSGSSYTNNQGSGSTLTLSGNLYTYTTTSGAVATFDRALKVDPSFAIADKYKANEARVTQLKQADGHQRDYTYAFVTYCAETKPSDPGVCIRYAKAIRLEAMKTNAGYQIAPTYQSDEVDAPQDLDAWYTLQSITGQNRVNCSGVNCNPATGWPTVTFSINSSGGSLFTSVSDAMSRVWRYRTDGTYLTGIYRPTNTGPSANTTINYYTTGGFIGRVSSIVQDGRTWSYSYAAGTGTLTTTVSYPMGGSRVVVFDTTVQQPISDTDGNGKTYNYEYDPANGHLTKALAPLDAGQSGTRRTTVYTYDDYGNVMNTTTTGQGVATTISTSAVFGNCPSAACATPTSTTDGNGNTTNYVSNLTYGWLESVTKPKPVPSATVGQYGYVRPQIRYSYQQFQASYKDTNGNIAPSGLPIWLPTKVSSCMTQSSCDNGADESRTITSYATGTNLLVQSVASGSGDGVLTATTSYAYDGIGNATSVDGPLPGTADTTVNIYNADRELVGTIGPDPDGSGGYKNRAVRTTFNADGQPTLVEQGSTNGQTSTDWAAFTPSLTMRVTYDAAGFKETEAMLVSGTPQTLTQYSYDGNGREDCVAQRMDPATLASTQPWACDLSHAAGVLPEDRITRTEYDAADQITKVWNAYRTSIATQAVRTTYTATGKVKTVMDGKDNLTTYTYDAFDRPYQLYYPSETNTGTSSSSDWEQRTYDLASNVTIHRRRNGQNITYGYDTLNRLAAMNQPTSYYAPGARFQYNNMDQITRAAEPSDSHLLTFTYDALGRQRTATSPYGNTGTDYDLAGRRTWLGYGDGFYVDYVRLVTGELVQVRENGATSGPGLLAQFAYDQLGRRTALLRGNGLYSAYGYDDVSRMNALRVYLSTGSTLMGYGYNPASQITTRSTDNDLLTVAVAPNVDRTYTTNGLNQYLQPYLVPPNNTKAYNAKGSMTKVGDRSYEYNPLDQLVRVNAQTSFYHDALGRTDYIETSGTAVGGWLYDGTDLIAEKNPSNNTVLRRYVHLDGVDEPLVWYEGSGTADRRFLSADERGSIVAVTNSTGGSIAVNAYDEWGLPGTGNVGRFQYTGQKWIPELQAYDYKARVYHPVLGRFLQADPIGYADSLNLYGYVLNDPLNLVDPDGLKWVYACVDDNCGYRWLPNVYTSVSSEPVTVSPGVEQTDLPTGEIVVTVTARPQKKKSAYVRFKNCAAAQYGFGNGKTEAGLDLAKIASEIGSLPVFKPLVGIPVIGESSSFTNVLNYTSLRLGLSARFQGSVLRSFTKAAFGSVRIATVLGRANVVIGGALLAYDAASIGICTARGD